MSRMTGNVIVVGSVNMDIVALTSRHPHVGETVAAHEVRYVPGGKGANQAVAAARSGATTRLVARLGADGFGDELFAFLASCGIDMELVARTVEESTGLALITLVEGSDNSIVVVPGTNRMLSHDDVDRAKIKRGDVVVTQFESPIGTASYALSEASRVGATSILNPSPARECPPGLLATPDVIVVNETELAWFADGADAASTADPARVIASARRLRARPDQAIVVTLGGAGAVVLIGEETSIVPARKTRVVDTTGAGDCFAGTMAAQLAAGKDLATAVGYGNIAASLCCEGLGAGISMPTKTAIEAEYVDL